MSVGTADLHTAITTAWNASTLNATFRDYWAVADTTEFPVLHDQQAGPAQPFPYCVYNMTEGSVVARMSGHTASERHEIRAVPVEFRIYARAHASVDKSAKAIAAELAEAVLKVVGGHPTVAQTGAFTLSNGAVLHPSYDNDIGMRDGDEEYSWILRYTFTLDVPVAT